MTGLHIFINIFSTHSQKTQKAEVNFLFFCSTIQYKSLIEGLNLGKYFCCIY